MNRLAYFFGLGVLLLLSSCGKDGRNYTESTEETTAEIEAAMMQGRNTAKEFVNKEWKDTLELMNHLVRAKTVQSKYLIDRKPRQAEAFDSGFIKTVRAVDPELAESITRKYAEVKQPDAEESQKDAADDKSKK